MDIKRKHSSILVKGIGWYLLTLLIVMVVAFGSYGKIPIDNDNDNIETGQSIPEIVFDNIINYPQARFSTKELNGKPAIMYFFSTGCKASFAHLSEINHIYNTHKQNFTLIMVGMNLDDDIEKVYEEYRRKYNLNLPVTFDKSVHKKYEIRGVPYVIWIKENGIVQALTNVLDEGYLKTFIDGKEFDFISWGPDARKLSRFDRDEPFLINGNGGEPQAFIQRSLLAEWKIGMPNDVPFANPNKSPLRGLKFLQAIGRGLGDLYRLAYFGKIYWNPEDSVYGRFHYSPILDINDKSVFQSDYNLGKNLFCYSQVLPADRRNPEQMMDVMQRDLKNFFGYDVVVETRPMPYLSLVVTDKTKMKSLITDGVPGRSSSSLIHVDYINQPVSGLIRLLDLQLNLGRKDLSLIDETGIQSNIDISFKGITTDFDEVRRALQTLGLDMLKREKPMKVIIIKDGKL